MKSFIGSLLCLVLISTAAHSEEFLEEKSTGVAKTSNGEIVYVEKHTSFFDENGTLVRLNTDYFEVGKDKKFGHYKTDYTNNPYLPDYEFRDFRRERMVQLEVEEKLAKAQVRFKDNEDIRKKSYERKKLMVAGQGFHSYMRSHVAEYAKNPKKVEDIHFLIPLNEASYEFRVRVKEYDKSKDNLTFRVEADSWFFRLFAPYIDVTYNVPTQRLLVFDGPSNLLSPEGDKMKVVITYSYDEATSEEKTAAN